MLKLTDQLYQYAPNHSPYMDYYERALVNHIAASQNPVTGKSARHGVTYMLPIEPGARKEYSNDYDDFTCCHGTGMENHVRYTESIYYHGTDASLMYGPLVMVALNERTKWIRLHIPPVPEDAFETRWENGMPTLWYDNLQFVPSYAAHHMAYHTYFKINLV